MNSLLGFFAPSPEHESNHIEAKVDGSLALTLLDHLPGDFSLGGYHLHISQTQGSSRRSLGMLDQTLILTDIPHGLKQLRCIVRPAEIDLQPGNYVLDLDLRGTSVVRRFLLVPGRAEL